MEISQGIYEFIINFKKANDGIAPTVREIMGALNMRSSSTTNVYLKRLESEGRIKFFGANSSRGIMVTGGEWTPPKG